MEILSGLFDSVELKTFNATSAKGMVSSFFSQLWFLVTNSGKIDIVYCWFAGYHSLLPLLWAKLFNIKSIVVLGGTDCHCFPEINHGNYRKALYGWFTKSSIKLAKIILPVHETLIESEPTYFSSKFPKQGFLPFVGPVKGKVIALDCGFEMAKVDVGVLPKVENSFLTVSGKLSGAVALRKGIDVCIELAKSNPKLKFTLVGGEYDGPTLENMRVLPRISYEELVQEYKYHQYYLQISIAEGFPNALAEAMLYGCIPIGSNAFGIPSIIGENGFIIHHKDQVETQQVIRNAIELTMEEKLRLAQAASDSIFNRFTIDKRASKLKQLIGE